MTPQSPSDEPDESLSNLMLWIELLYYETDRGRDLAWDDFMEWLWSRITEEEEESP